LPEKKLNYSQIYPVKNRNEFIGEIETVLKYQAADCCKTDNCKGKLIAILSGSPEIVVL
jgi:hypothetical protein